VRHCYCCYYCVRVIVVVSTDALMRLITLFDANCCYCYVALRIVLPCVVMLIIRLRCCSLCLAVACCVVADYAVLLLLLLLYVCCVVDCGD